jgi:hypothetical protein
VKFPPAGRAEVHPFHFLCGKITWRKNVFECFGDAFLRAHHCTALLTPFELNLQLMMQVIFGGRREFIPRM